MATANRDFFTLMRTKSSLYNSHWSVLTLSKLSTWQILMVVTKIQLCFFNGQLLYRATLNFTRSFALKIPEVLIERVILLYLLHMSGEYNSTSWAFHLICWIKHCTCAIHTCHSCWGRLQVSFDLNKCPVHFIHNFFNLAYQEEL